MPLVTVKPKFQVTIPARLRKGIDLHEGDLMEATLVGDGILFTPKAVVDRGAAADRIAAALAPAGDRGRSEDEIVRPGSFPPQSRRGSDGHERSHQSRSRDMMRGRST